MTTLSGILSSSYTGATGPQGATGVQGASGSTGLQGASGIQGASGSTGIQGASGIRGASGSTGITGASGVQGASGVNGSTGPQGATGLTGSTGPQVSPSIGSTGITSGTITPDSSVTQYSIVGLTDTTAIAAPSGSPTNGQKLVLRIKDSGVTRQLSWTTTSGGYRAVGITLPLTTVAGKNTYVGCIYNSTDTFWDVVAVTTEA